MSVLNYDFAATPVTWSLAMPTLAPSICTWNPLTCSLDDSSPRKDLCTIIEGTTVSSFDSASGDFSFQSKEVERIPAGTYVFRITASTGVGPVKALDTTFSLVITNPCTTFEFTLQNPTPFPTTKIRHALIEQAAQSIAKWNTDTVATRSVTHVYCGPN